LEAIFNVIGAEPETKICAAILGITDEAVEIMEEYRDSPALDAGLLAAAQAVEHYEMSRNGSRMKGAFRTVGMTAGTFSQLAGLPGQLEKNKPVLPIMQNRRIVVISDFQDGEWCDAKVPSVAGSAISGLQVRVGMFLSLLRRQVLFLLQSMVAISSVFHFRV